LERLVVSCQVIAKAASQAPQGNPNHKKTMPQQEGAKQKNKKKIK
jgi:hypothetical protein